MAQPRQGFRALHYLSLIINSRFGSITHCRACYSANINTTRITPEAFQTITYTQYMFLLVDTSTKLRVNIIESALLAPPSTIAAPSNL